MSSSEGHVNLGDDLEMDAIPSSAARHARSRSRAKSVSRSSLKEKDYAIGIGMLLMVVLLWTSSNFLTQASRNNSNSFFQGTLSNGSQNLFERGYEKPFLSVVH
jgi:solute carrier family 35, member F5